MYYVIQIQHAKYISVLKIRTVWNNK